MGSSLKGRTLLFLAFPGGGQSHAWWPLLLWLSLIQHIAYVLPAPNVAVAFSTSCLDVAYTLAMCCSPLHQHALAFSNINAHNYDFGH